LRRVGRRRSSLLMAFRLDVSNWPLEKRKALLESNPHLKPEDVGILSESPPPEAKKPKAGGRKAWRGTISFDSETEASVYDRLCEEHVAVVAHGKIALSEDRHLEPDFIIIHQVDDDGRFEGEFADAKAVWKRKTKSGNKVETVHAEDDWKVK